MENAFSQPQTVVVFGGSSDIARGIVERLAEARARTVVLAGRNESLLREAGEAIRAKAATDTPVVLFDAEEPRNAGETVDAAFAAAGAPVDLVIIAVGLLGDQSNDENDPAAAARMAAVNFSWPVAALAALRSRLIAQGSGRIVVISSVAAIRVARRSYLYGGAKAGLDRLCDAMADSLVGTGVTLQILRPGPVRTRMTAGMKEAPFTTDVSTVVEVTLKGLTSSRRVLTSPPQLAYIFAILRHLPAPLWRKVNDQR